MFVPQVSDAPEAVLSVTDDLVRSFRLSQYYTFVNKDPSKLHCFYTKKSTFTHGVEGEDNPSCYGQQVCHHCGSKILDLLMSARFVGNP